MDNSEKNQELEKKLNDTGLTKKDIIAIMIAQFEILAPIMVIFCVGMWAIILLLLKFWLKV